MAMLEMTFSNTETSAPATLRGEYSELTGVAASAAAIIVAARGRGSNVEHYRTYYRAFVAANASRCEGRRGLEAVKLERRRARREKWLRSIKKSPAGVLINPQAAS